MNIPSLATTLHRVFSSFSRTGPQVNTIPDKVDDMSVSQGFTAGSAQAEGWDVFDCGVREDGSTCREIQRLDSPSIGVPTFADDGSAWEHVVAKARAGSPLHQAALRIVDPVERSLIRFWCSAEDLLP